MSCVNNVNEVCGQAGCSMYILYGRGQNVAISAFKTWQLYKRKSYCELGAYLVNKLVITIMYNNLDKCYIVFMKLLSVNCTHL